MGALDLGVLDRMDDGAIEEVVHSWSAFSEYTVTLLSADGGAAVLGEHPEFEALVGNLCRHGLSSLARDHFWQSLEDDLQNNVASRFWSHFSSYYDTASIEDIDEAHLEQVLVESLTEICSTKDYHEKCLILLLQSLQPQVKGKLNVEQPLEITTSEFRSMHKLMVSSVLLNTIPPCFPDILACYFQKKLDYLSKLAAVKSEKGGECEICPHNLYHGNHMACVSNMDIDGDYFGRRYTKNHSLVESMGKVVHDLRNVGFTSIAEDAYASAVFLLLKAKVHSLALEDYRNPILVIVKQWIQDVPLQFLNGLLAYLGDPISNDAVLECKPPLASSLSCLPEISVPSERLVRWQLRLEYFAYETLQDLRIDKLFEIIVDYPDSSSAIEDLRQCLEYTGQHSKLVNSFITSLRYRLLTAGASTNDILHQYVSTIKALRTIDPTGIFLEAVGEPIRDYLRGRKDTIKCIVTMLTDGSGGNANGTGSGGDSLLEELNRDAESRESADYDDDCSVDEKQSWINFKNWEPDPVEADASKCNRSRRKPDILGMIVSIIGSKDQLVNEYRVMLAEKLLNKSNYDVDSEIRTLELLKIHFGESSMQRCEIMLNDFIDSKRTNTNIKASKHELSISGDGRISFDHFDTTIISSNFWPTIQSESFHIPTSVDQLLNDYANRYHEIKAPRKLSWIKNLGTVELELQFEGRTLQLTVAPVHAAIIMKFEEQTCWICDDLAVAMGLPVEHLIRKMSFWINKGIVMESFEETSEGRIFTLVDQMSDINKNDVAGGYDVMLSADEEGERPIASVEEQLQKEMTVFENFIIGMLTNFGNMTSDRIHNTLKMFCTAEPAYDKSLQQLQSFLSSLVSEEKLEMRDGSYYLKK